MSQDKLQEQILQSVEENLSSIAATAIKEQLQELETLRLKVAKLEEADETTTHKLNRVMRERDDARLELQELKKAIGDLEARAEVVLEAERSQVEFRLTAKLEAAENVTHYTMEIMRLLARNTEFRKSYYKSNSYQHDYNSQSGDRSVLSSVDTTETRTVE